MCTYLIYLGLLVVGKGRSRGSKQVAAAAVE